MSTNLPAVLFDDAQAKLQRKLGNFVYYFQVNLPTNGQGIPLRLVNPMGLMTVLPECESTDDVPEDVFEDALWDVQIEDAMPLINGIPIWERFDGEQVQYYKFFKEYRESLYTTGSRAIVKVAESLNVEPRALTLLSKTYHWQLRCKAYDLHQRHLAERKRLYAIEKMESKHKETADKLLEMSMDYMENHTEQLNPKIALQMLETAVKMGRLSLGLSPDKPGTGESGGTSININQSSNAPLGEMNTSVEVNQGGNNTGSATEDLSKIQSILHILDKSGALDKVNVVEADYTVVEDENQVEGV